MSISGVIAVVGALLMVLAAIGVVRFPDLYSRMHAATKAQTVGFVLVAVAGIIAVPTRTPKLALVATLVFVTAPVAAHLLSRSAYRPGQVALDIEGDEPEWLARDVTDDEPDDGGRR